MIDFTVRADPTIVARRLPAPDASTSDEFLSLLRRLKRSNSEWRSLTFIAVDVPGVMTIADDNVLVKTINLLGADMSLVPTMNTNALHILQQTQSLKEPWQARSPIDISTQPVQSASSQTEPLKLLDPARSKLSESIFSVNNVDVNKMKLNLIDRAGKALGADPANYASQDDFIEAMQDIVRNLKLHGNEDVINSVEKETGLTKLGISLEDLVNSTDDPEANERVTKALERMAGKEGEDKDSEDPKGLLGVDVNAEGIYTLSAR